MQYYNAHSHVFTMKNAPRQFLSLYMPEFLAKAIDTVTNTDAGAASVAWLLSKLPGAAGKRYASFLKIGKSTEQIDVFRTLRDQYDDQHFRFVGLTMYMEDCGAQDSLSGYEGQLDGVIEIKRQYPDNFLVFLGVDPRWKGTATELRRTVEAKFNARIAVTSARSVYPFVGLKLYPSTGFYAFDPKLGETLEWAAENHVPIVTHCNYLGGIYNNDAHFLRNSISPLDPYNNKPYPGKYVEEFKLGRWLTGTHRSRNNKLTCSYFLEPESFRGLLQSHEGKDPLKICFAHYGGAQQIITQSNGGNNNPPIGINSRNWCGQIQLLMRDFSQVYTDISYALSNKDTHAFIIKKELRNPVYGNRILFGTDFFMTERVLPEKKDYYRFRNAAQQVPGLIPQKNAWDAIAGDNVHAFLQSKFYDGNVI